MVRHVLAAAAASIALAPTPTPQPPATPAARPSSGPCPIASGVPTAHPVPTATPPTHDPTRLVIGGEALGTPGLTLPAGAPPPPSNLSATAWLVADLDSGAVLGGCGPHEYRAPASVQKLLLAATLLPKLDPAQVVEVVPADLDFERGSSAVGLLVGGKYSIETLWLGLLLNSGNDAATVLARVGGGPAGVAGTIDAMNALAREIGAYDTHAVTPSGLDGPGQYPGALGGKTGYTEQARHTYVGAAERGGRRLVVTLLGAEAQPVRGWQQGAALLDWGFTLPPDASVGRLVEPGEAAAILASPRAGVPASRAARMAGATRTRWPASVMVGGVPAVAAVVLMLALAGARRRRRQRWRARHR